MILKDILFPKICVCCGFLGSYLCPHCFKKLSPIDRDICLQCRRASYKGLTHPSCHKLFGIDGCISLYRYNPILQRIIKTIKYRLATEVWEEFYRLIPFEIRRKVDFYKALDNKTVIQPVPLHEDKLRERGFNQAVLIANLIALITDKPIVDALCRKKKTKTQAEMKKKIERYQNTKGAFSVKDTSLILGKTIVIIDDVVTTGYTLNEASYALKKKGAVKVYAVTMAQG